MKMAVRSFIIIALAIAAFGFVAVKMQANPVYAQCSDLDACLSNEGACRAADMSAADCYDEFGGINVAKPTGALSSIPAILSGAIQLILIIAGLIAFVYLLLGGMKWISSGGDKGEVETARNQIIQALIGLIVVLAAWGLIILVQAMTGVCLGFGCSLSVPTLF